MLNEKARKMETERASLSKQASALEPQLKEINDSIQSNDSRKNELTSQIAEIQDKIFSDFSKKVGPEEF